MSDKKKLSVEELQEIVVEISGRIGFAVDQTRELAIQLLDNVNDHQVATAIRAIDLGDVGLACDFLRFGMSGGWLKGGSPEETAHQEKLASLHTQLDALRASHMR